MNNDTKRIAQNTVLLYIRMILLLLINLYYSRVMLNALGIDDFGIYNVVGGFVAMFGIFSGTLVNSINRFMAVGLGKNDKDGLSEIFSTSINIQILFATAIVIIIEIFGNWFLYSKMSIADNRLIAASWVLHCSTLAFATSMLTIPYTALIIAHERMKAFAYVSLFEAIIKLVIAFALFVVKFDKLVILGILSTLVPFILLLIYSTYCKRNFDVLKYSFRINKTIAKKMFGFVGWHFFGNGAVYLNNYGVNLLINVYFGVALNAARGICMQVNTALQQFSSNFIMALSPQITKSYASGNKDYAFRLTCSGSKLSFFLMFIISLPVLLETEMILQLWLGTPPELCASFIRWTILASLFSVISNVQYYLQMAHGDIRKYQLWSAVIGGAVLPSSWALYELGFDVIWSFVLTVFASILMIGVRLFIVNEKTGFPIGPYVRDVLFRSLFAAAIASIIPCLYSKYTNGGFYKLVIVTSLSLIFSVIILYLIGLNKEEKSIVMGFVKKKIKRLC